MDQVGLHYVRRKNTFTWLEDIEATQTLFNQQLQSHWPTLLDGLADTLNPIHADIFANDHCRYHWSVQESEWATDVMFRSRAALQACYPQLIRYAVTTFESLDVLRFLGQAVPATGKIPHHRRFEMSTNLGERVEGVRLKHWLDGNSIKVYDKGSVLRVESTVKKPANFKVYRPLEGDPEGPKDWRPMRLGIADLHHRGERGQAANERYLQALAQVHDATPLRQLVEPLCRPAADLACQRRNHRDAAATDHAGSGSDAPALAVAVPAAEAGQRVARARRARALNPLAADDAALLAHISRHEFLINGLRNRDLRPLLFGTDPAAASELRKRSAAVTRKLRLLRAHGLIHKIPTTQRYLVSAQGRKAIMALLAARNASTEQLTSAAG
jgi:hypothetical protein